MFNKILAALVLAFAFLFAPRAWAQQPKDDGGDAPRDVCKDIEECQKKHPAPPPQYRCGEGTAEEGQTLVSKLCTCADPYRNHVVHSLIPGSYNTLVCVPKASIWKKADGLDARTTKLEQTKADKADLDQLRKEHDALKKDYDKFKSEILDLGLDFFIENTNRRLAALEAWREDIEPRLRKVEKDVTNLTKSALQFTLGVEGGGNFRSANGTDENGTGGFNAGAGYFVGTFGLQGYFTDVVGLAAKFKAGLLDGAQTNGVAGEIGGAAGLALRLDPVYMFVGPAWYTLVVGHHTDAGGEGNFRGWGIGGEADVGYRPIPQLEIGLDIFAGGGHNGSAEIPVEGGGAWVQGGLYLNAVLGAVDDKSESPAK